MTGKRVSPVDAARILTDYYHGASINSLSKKYGYAWKTVKRVITSFSSEDKYTEVGCGSVAGYTKHHREGTIPCRECCDAIAAYNKQWRAKNVEGYKPRNSNHRHGSRRTYQYHLRLGEVPCDRCKAANARYTKDLRRKSRGL